MPILHITVNVPEVDASLVDPHDVAELLVDTYEMFRYSSLGYDVFFVNAEWED